MRVFLMAYFCLASAMSSGYPAFAAEDNLPKTRFPPGAESVPRPDDSEAARRAAVRRLRSESAGVRHPVCPGAAGQSDPLLGTPCGGRQFDAPPILETPGVEWFTNRGWWDVNPFALLGDKLIAISCGNETNKGLAAFDLRDGKVLWGNRAACEIRGGNGVTPRFFELPNHRLLFINEYNHVQYDPRTGKQLDKASRKFNWWTLRRFDGQFISHRAGDTPYLANWGETLGKQPLWKLEAFRKPCFDPRDDNECLRHGVFSLPAYSDGVLYVSAASSDPAAEPVRQVHAIDMKTGQVLWRHTGQPVWKKDGRLISASHDTSPILADGKLIVRVDGLLGGQSDSYAFRALDARSGRAVWTTAPIPGSFAEEWLPRRRLAQKSQHVENHLVAGDMLIVQIAGGEPGHRDLWAYRLADGRPAWRRGIANPRSDEAGMQARLGASAGGVVYLMSDREIQAVDGKTGTLLWTFQPPDNDAMPAFMMRGGGEAAPGEIHLTTEMKWDDGWTIGPDGAFYGTTPQGPFKIR